jgi:hypothetical protein
MSNSSDQPDTGISDEKLPEDLQPTEDNPLAQPLPEDAEQPDLEDGKGIEGSDDSGDTGGTEGDERP